jgi:hypothetical protein
MAIHDLQALLNWKLLEGSHDFPGPDGGTCISEAAIVAAGLEYREVGILEDLPPCFSKPISAFVINLNDLMPHDLRQELLLPFVMRLAGSADTPEIECERCSLIVIRTVNDLLPIALRRNEFEAIAKDCERARTLDEAWIAAKMACNVCRYSLIGTIIAAVEGAAECSSYSVKASAVVANRIANTQPDGRSVWIKATLILDAALRVGRQADPVEVPVIRQRMEDAKKLATASH